LIRYSIAALAEFFNFQLIRLANVKGWRDVNFFFWAMGERFLTGDVQNRMRMSGWCPSAIENLEVRYTGLQTLHLLSKMDKSMPIKDHSRCTTDVCANYQIDPSSYESAHYGDGCRCAKLEINSSLISESLMKGDSIPLLKIIPGDDLGKLRIGIVESSSDTPYVALSHVWADGLGNPSSNSLHRCQLARLKGLLEWLDTSTITMDSRIPDTIKAKSVSLL
jgi:hypothetical protein